MPDNGDTKQIEGVCTEISEKNGWTAFAIDIGSQYPVRLSTKLPALIEKGRAVGQQRAVWTFKESQGKENPNKPGTFFTNRYFDSVEVGGTVNHNNSSSSAPSRDETRGSIERQVIVKEMVQHYPGIDKLSVDQWWGLMGELEQFLSNGVEQVAPVMDEHGRMADDIPFQ